MVFSIIYRSNEEFSSAPGVQPKEYSDLSTVNLDALRTNIENTICVLTLNADTLHGIEHLNVLLYRRRYKN